jgi:peptidyl-prolyl cis-trans isomerase A (cyclophilin A)
MKGNWFGFLIVTSVVVISAQAQGQRGTRPAEPETTAPAANMPPSMPSLAAPVNPVAPEINRLTVKTSMGDFVVRLFRRQAPVTVNHFVALATGQRSFVDVASGRQVTRPFYDGLIFHRVIKDFLIQGGCPFGTGRGGSGETIRDEWSSTMVFDRPGLVAMAPLRNSNFTPVPNSSSSQFFITLTERPELNEERYTIFGEIEKGLSVVRKIASTPTGPTDRPIKKVTILSIGTD